MAKANRDKGKKKVPDDYIKQYEHMLRKKSPALQKHLIEGSWKIEENPTNGQDGTR